jgi:S-adenosylmethionine hydrolase
VTREAGVDVEDFGITLPQAPVGCISEVVLREASTQPAELKQKSMKAWTHARTFHTREAFARRRYEIIREIFRRRGQRCRVTEVRDVQPAGSV